MRVARNGILQVDAQKREMEHKKEMETLKKHMSETQASVLNLTQPETQDVKKAPGTGVKEEDPDFFTQGTQVAPSQGDGNVGSLKSASDDDDDDLGQLTPPARGA